MENELAQVGVSGEVTADVKTEGDSLDLSSLQIDDTTIPVERLLDKDESLTISRNKKLRQKLLKKSRKCFQIIENQSGVTLNENIPHKWVAIWGVGMAYGDTKEGILAYCKRTPVELRCMVDQSFVFARLATENAAEKFKDTYHGSCGSKPQTTIYVGFVGKACDVPREDAKYLGPFYAPLPEGLTIVPNFVDCDFEFDTLRHLYVDPSLADVSPMLKKRTVQHFGYDFQYKTNYADINKPLDQKIPDYLQVIIHGMRSLQLFQDECPDQLTVNQYEPGQGIPPHCDTHSCFEGPIVSLSLGCDIVMDFRRGASSSSIVLPARSLLIMDGPSRLGWTHGITPRKMDIVPDSVHGGLTLKHRDIRMSLTFRLLRRGKAECNCSFPEMCDSQRGKISEQNAATLEDDLVHKVYEDIASHFSETRSKPWPKVESFVKDLEPGAYMLDVGCANGKYFGINQEIVEVGIDMSHGLLMKSQEKGYQVVRGNALSLPFQANYFDAVISIAVLHHIATQERRVQFLEEIMRVMKPGAKALIYVWAKQQRMDDDMSVWSERQATKGGYQSCDNREEEMSKYAFLPVHNRDVEFPESDMLVPWVLKGENGVVRHRFYHVFEDSELNVLISGMKSAPVVVNNYFEQGNWAVIIQKS